MSLLHLQTDQTASCPLTAKKSTGNTGIIREGVVAVIERDGRYLTIVRAQTVVAPGKVCFPGGGIESGETPEDALVRECREELGVQVRPLRQLEISVTSWGVRLYWWSAELLSDHFSGAVEFRPDSREVAEVRWMSIEEMLRHPDILESNIPFIQRLGDFAGRFLG